MRIEDEIKQKSFVNEYVKAQVNILFTSSWLSYATTQELKSLDISAHQFNILRILRGMYPTPSSIKELTERMIDKTSNASRLVDKLISKNLVLKAKCDQDNRRAEVIISNEGLELLKIASERVDSFANIFSNRLSNCEVVTLNELLDKLRG
ncbi:MAG: MarR family transcriptional regulator [Saprospiraceae bacterium]|nr:MarR family transcriptional regulator [Saprospiraceae bacterium]MCF8249276.1 MarR family transcriptional regulator [Saprospiraceae bacterium]MCF8281156.1 MarR family transcriptional regulator [Bacteroidales bacterium]MCF8311447.1 MarR family transcriptional regulator [Saprospiraceae bacterium]MCF8439895.1 MarR family transcriptional regulator [Saprospiraceae bacterium]